MITRQSCRCLGPEFVTFLCTSVDDSSSGLTVEGHLEEWKRRGHLIKRMPFHRLASYLRFGISRELALVDAIICWAATSIIAWDGEEMERRYPLSTALWLADDVATLPEACAMRDGRKWKRLPFIVFHGAAECPLPEDYLEFPENVVLLDLTCNRFPLYALARIQSCVDGYYARVLQDYECSGLLVRFERGHIQIGPALRQREGEGTYYLGKADTRNNRGWVTVKRDREGLTHDVSAFQLLLERWASETEMHEFFEQHPAILMEATGRIPLSHRPTFSDPKGTQPDYSLTPILGPAERESPFGLLELKGPGEAILTKGLHGGFAAKVHGAVNQIRDYNRYLHDPSNRQAVIRSLGYIPTTPALAVLIGRAPKRDSELEMLRQRRAEIGVKIVTYDEILQTQADQVGGHLY